MRITRRGFYSAPLANRLSGEGLPFLSSEGRGLQGCWRTADALTGEDLLSHRDTGRVVRRQVKIDTGAELDHADTFPFFTHIASLRITDDAPGYEARDLHHDEVPVIGLQGIGAAFVIPGGFVQGRVEEFAGVIADVFDAGIDRHPVHVHVKQVHEDADAGEPLSRERFVGLLDAHDPAVGRTEGAVLLLWADPFRITEKMAGQPEYEQEGQGR